MKTEPQRKTELNWLMWALSKMMPMTKRAKTHEVEARIYLA